MAALAARMRTQRALSLVWAAQPPRVGLPPAAEELELLGAAVLAAEGSHSSVAVGLPPSLLPTQRAMVRVAGGLKPMEAWAATVGEH